MTTMLRSYSVLLACGLLVSAALFPSATATAKATPGYEVWASDQSNSVEGQTALGVKGSFLWIWDSDDIEKQLAGGDIAEPLPCTPGATKGPCDAMEVFPQDLAAHDSGELLGDLPAFGRLHGMLKDPQNKYASANFFVRGGGYVGIIGVETKAAVALFRVTEFTFGPDSTTSRSVHMSFWNADGSAILIANLHGKAIERINVQRDADGTITDAVFDYSATIGLGQSMEVSSPANYFTGKNAFGADDLIGRVTGSYDDADLGDLTPNNVCKENGCGSTSGDSDGAAGGRGNNLPICPIPSSMGLVYTTLAGGGMLVLDSTTTPMSIVGEYGNQFVYGAGCGGVETRGKMYTNSGVSASGAGASQSMFALWEFDDSNYLSGGINAENDPAPVLVYQDEETNTLTGGNQVGTKASDTSGQIPGVSTRRDSHGAAATPINDVYVHVVDRIQNVVEVFKTSNFDRSTYSLMKGGACEARAIPDGGAGFPLNDPAPDLFEATPDGKYMMIAFRGPAPVSVPHAAQGSCPGVGIVQLSPNGKTGTLVDVLRATNTVQDDIGPFEAPGGMTYSGEERSDVHGAIVVEKLK